MAISLENTGFRVEALGVVGHEDNSVEPWSYRSVPSLALDLCGVEGDRHYGSTRVWRSYDSVQLRGRTMPNDRQLSIVSASDLLEIAQDLDLPIDVIEERAETTIAQFTAEQLAANMMLAGEASLNQTLSPGVLLVFGEDTNASPVVRITEYNQPCKHPVRKLVQSIEMLGRPLADPAKTTRQFIDVAAKYRRGWVGSVIALSADNQTNTVSVGQSVHTHEPLLSEQ